MVFFSLSWCDDVIVVIYVKHVGQEIGEVDNWVILLSQTVICMSFMEETNIRQNDDVWLK